MNILKSKKGISLAECAIALIVFSIISVSVLSVFALSARRNEMLLDRYNGWILTDNAISCFQSSNRVGVDEQSGQFLKLLGDGAVKLSYPSHKEKISIDINNNENAQETIEKVEIATYYYWYIPNNFSVGCFIEANYTEENIVIYDENGVVKYDPNIRIWVLEASEVRKLLNDSAVKAFFDSNVDPDITYRKG